MAQVGVAVGIPGLWAVPMEWDQWIIVVRQSLSCKGRKHRFRAPAPPGNFTVVSTGESVVSQDGCLGAVNLENHGLLDYYCLVAVLYCVCLLSFLQAYKELKTHMYVVTLFTEFHHLSVYLLLCFPLDSLFHSSLPWSISTRQALPI